MQVALNHILENAAGKRDTEDSANEPDYRMSAH